MTMAVAVRSLRKSFGATRVLDGIDLDAPAGGLVALLGPNGAGKTTTVRILTTLLRPDSGAVRVAGIDVVRDPRRARQAIGVTGQQASVDGGLTGRENMRLIAQLTHLPRGDARRRIDELLEAFELTAVSGRPAKTYSGGTRRKLDLAMSLIARPQVVFLDEPTTGLDPRSRQTMWAAIRQLTADGVTIFLTTQYLQEADELADHIVLIDAGKVVARGTADELKREIPGAEVELAFGDELALRRACTLLGIPRPSTERTLRTPTNGSPDELRQLLNQLADHAIEVADVTLRKPSLDDVFLTLTARRPALQEELAS